MRDLIISLALLVAGVAGAGAQEIPFDGSVGF